MKEDIQRRVVRIELPLVDGYSYFSGYIIGDGTIITCRHGFVKEGISDYKKDESIEVVAQGYKSRIPLNGASNINELNGNGNGIILFESEKYDIVIFKDEKAKGQYSDLALSEWDDLADWEGGGYPSYNADEEETKGYESLDGQASAAAIDGKVLKLKTNKSLVAMQGWNSVSGSPIFPRGKTNLIGIVRNYDQDVNKQLEAVYLKRLWDDEVEQADFKRVLNHVRSQQVCIYNKAKLKEFLEKEDNLAKKIAEHLKIAENELADTLLSLDKKDIMNLGISLKTESKTYQFLKHAFTCHYDNSDLFKDPPTHEKPYTTVLCVGVVPCEFTMAAKSGRDPIFTLTAEGEIQEGLYSLTTPPESGIHSEASADIASELLSGNAILQPVTERLAADFKTRKNISGDEKRIAQAAKLVLENANGKYYLQVEKVTDKNIKVLQELHRTFSDITIIELAEDNDLRIENEENKVFDKLISFIKDNNE